MRKLLTGVALLGTLAFAGVSQAADGNVTMKWTSCAGAVDITPTAAQTSLYISVLGIDVLHKAYDVRFIYGNSTQTVPDAWRFDTDGCETNSLITQNVTAKSCPAFQQAGTGNLQIKKVEFSPPQDNYANSLMRVLLANAYAPVATVSAGTNYLLEQVIFDLTSAVTGPSDPGVTCGGLEQQMCFKLSYATYLDLNGIETPFGRTTPVISVTTNDAANSGVACGAVPAQAKTWGSIKSQYRY